MTRFVRSLVVALAIVGAATAVARADELKLPTPPAKGGPEYGTVEARPGRHVESVLTQPRSALTKQGTGWLLHFGSAHDNCSRVDETPGLRLMCVVH